MQNTLKVNCGKQSVCKIKAITIKDLEISKSINSIIDFSQKKLLIEFAFFYHKDFAAQISVEYAHKQKSIQRSQNTPFSEHADSGELRLSFERTKAPLNYIL